MGQRVLVLALAQGQSQVPMRFLEYRKGSNTPDSTHSIWGQQQGNADDMGHRGGEQELAGESADRIGDPDRPPELMVLPNRMVLVMRVEPITSHVQHIET